MQAPRAADIQHRGAAVTLGALASVPDLRIESNHALSPSAFDGVQTVQSPIAGNAPAP
jgi:hypothetical protein